VPFPLPTQGKGIAILYTRIFMKKTAFCILLFVTGLLQAHPATLAGKEKALMQTFGHLYEAVNDSARNITNDSLCIQLESVLHDPASFGYAFDSLPFLGKIYSTDKQLRIYSWNYISDAGDYRFCSFIQRKADGAVFPLIQNRASFPPADDKPIGAAEWYGALYYQAIPYPVGQSVLYLLLGWSHSSPSENFKVIDVLSVSENGLSFGYPLFKQQNRKADRVVLAYSARYSLSLQYEDDHKRFVFNHLHRMSTAESTLQPPAIPDESFSAYILKNGIFEYVDEVNKQAGKNDYLPPRTKIDNGLEGKEKDR
jgi:hypothetical protein